MTFDEVMGEAIRRGMEAVRVDYAEKPQKRDGALAGMMLCEGKSAEELLAVWVDVSADTERAFREHADDYWYWRCRQSEVEWCLNVASAALQTPLLPHLPTYRAACLLNAILSGAPA